MQHTEQDNSHVRHTGQAPIFLIGMMGAGKTTIGRGLARSLGREFLDLDHELEARCGVSIPTIFDIEGEAGFRRRETQVLQDITLRRDVVLATGGGAVVAPENQELLRARGIVLYLKAGSDELFRRVAKDKNRPMLLTANPKARIVELLRQREPIYESLADFTVETSHGSINTVLDAIDRLLKDYQQRGERF
jgi:shikimate kinase